MCFFRTPKYKAPEVTTYQDAKAPDYPSVAEQSKKNPTARNATILTGGEGLAAGGIMPSMLPVSGSTKKTLLGI